MNWTANMLGLGNMATPMGLKAMTALQELNPNKQHASNSMATFLALNTGAFTLIPMTVINYLNTAGVKNPYEIIVPTICSTACGYGRSRDGCEVFPAPADVPNQCERTGGSGGKAASGTAGAPYVQRSAMSSHRLRGAELRHHRRARTRAAFLAREKTLLTKTGIANVIAVAEKPAQAAVAEAVTSTEVPTIRRVMNGVSGLAILASCCSRCVLRWAVV